jgi:uncharacterized protein (TIGR02145 family)
MYSPIFLLKKRILRFHAMIPVTFCFIFSGTTAQQIGIGTLSPHPSAILEIRDTAKGLLLPRITEAARSRMPNVKGMMVYDSVSGGFWINDGTGWSNLPPRGQYNGQLMYWNGRQWTTLAPGLGGQVLTMGSEGAAPSWRGATTDTAFIDPRDGHRYSIRQYGNKVWMTENLNYAAGGSLCYDNVGSNCLIYGRLYDYYSAISAAPSGWHLASDAEWDSLVNFLGGAAVAGEAMKSIQYWQSPNVANNSSGFSVLPAGWYYNSVSSFFNGLGINGFFWSSTAKDFSLSWARSFNTGASVSRLAHPWQDLLSVRCVKD